MPAISVIVPVYNVEKYLARCLDSILNQSFTDFEVICVNDGSQDKSLAILHDYAQKDTRITVLNQENQGISTARNNAMKRAQGEYISFVDSDDAIEKQCLEMAYTLAITHQADMVCWSFTASNGQDLPSANFAIPPSQVNITRDICSLYENSSQSNYRVWNNVWSKLYHKALIQSVPFAEGVYYEDAVHTWQIMLLRPKTVIITTPLSLYTTNENSITHKKVTLKHIEDYHSIIKLIYLALNTPSTQNELSIFKERSIPDFLNAQIGRIAKTSIPDQLPLWLAFEEQLHDLDAKGIFPLHNTKRRYHRICQYILQHGAKAYYEKNILYWYKKPFHKKQDDAINTYYIFGIKIFAKEKLGDKQRALHILGMTFKYSKRTS